jgi:hypothetical protein
MVYGAPLRHVNRGANRDFLSSLPTRVNTKIAGQPLVVLLRSYDVGGGLGTGPSRGDAKMRRTLILCPTLTVEMARVMIKCNYSGAD